MQSREPHGLSSLSSLRVWIPLVIAMFVILGSVGLVLVFERKQTVDEREAFAELARVNAGFMERTRLPRTEQMASRLSEVIGAQVCFRDPGNDRVIGPPNYSLSQMAIDRAVDDQVVVLPGGKTLLMLVTKGTSQPSRGWLKD